MPLTVTCSAMLPLARLHTAGGVPALLGVTLHTPTVSLAAYPASGLLVSGARANVALAFAERFLLAHGVPRAAAIEVELAIPRAMGLGSEGLLGLAVGRALAELYGLPADVPSLARTLGLDSRHALLAHGFAHGGLLLAGTQPDATGLAPLLQRHELAQSDDEAWAWVLVLPHPPVGLALEFEEQRLEEWLHAAPATDGVNSAEPLWAAAKRDDLEGFGAALHEALPDDELNDGEQAVLEVMRAGGAAACGRVPTGLALYALMRGASATARLRQALSRSLGYDRGTITAAITSNHGVTVTPGP